MNAAQGLEFHRVRELVAAYCGSVPGAERIRASVPLDDRDEVARAHAHVSVFARAIEDGRTMPSGDVPDCDPILEEVRRPGAVIDGESLRGIAALIRYAADLRRVIGDADCSAFGEAVRAATPPTALGERIERFIRLDGAVDEDQIPEIARIKSEIMRLNRSILDTASAMIRSAPDMYHGDQPTMRDGRTVLPVGANFRGRLDGIVHEYSGSGETVFVEPTRLVDLNNDLAKARVAIHREIQRVLRELSTAVRDVHAELAVVSDAMVEMDTALARARYGRETGGTLIPPGTRLKLVQARHPLLGMRCVPLDLTFDENVRLIVISGPNTGGKTVLLKTVGLLTMMNQCAIPIAAHPESELPIFTSWAVDIGDEQSLDESLSTFSAHLRTLAEACRVADSGSLILLDELGSGTDPEEGAALSMAIVDHLVERGSTVVVTTHQTVLKHYGYTRPFAANASMAFDDATGTPTYRVVSGRPGMSHALDTARNQGLDGSIMQRAVTYLEHRESSVAEIIARLRDRERELEALAAEATARQTALEHRERELAERDAELRRRETTLRTEGLRELDAVIRDARKTIEGEVRRIRERGGQLERTDVTAAQKELRELEARAEAERETVAAERQRAQRNGPRSENRPTPGTITKGTSVRHASTGRTGIVRTIRGERAEVQFGAVRMTLSLSDLEVYRDDGQRPSRSSPRVDVTLATDPGSTTASVGLSLDIRGMRFQAALEEVERYLDGAIMGGLTHCAIIHGTGTGALQQGVHDYLRHRSDVASFSYALPEDGGFGKTNVELA